MRTVMLVTLAGMLGVAWAGEPDAKAKRIAELTAAVAKGEAYLAKWTPEKLDAQKKADAKDGTSLARSVGDGVARYKSSLPALKTELSWLKGELTADSAGKAVKAAEDALAKAPEAEKPKAQAALDEAKRARDQVASLEAKSEM